MGLGLEITRVDPAYRNNDPVEAREVDYEIFYQVQPFTMTGRKRILSLIAAVRHVVENEIPGDFVECGVWRGGSAMAIALTLLDLGVTDRKILLFDTFEGMTPPENVDVKIDSGMASDTFATEGEIDGHSKWLFAGLNEVRSAMESTLYPEEMIEYRVGDVAATLLGELPDSISLLRLDTDWYASTKIELEVLFPRLSFGGICIIDDYGHWLGSRRAVDEYFHAHSPRPFFQRVDHSARMAVKTTSG